MSKVRVYELARDLKIESKILMNTLKAIGIQLPSHQSVLTDDQVDQLKKAISGETTKDQGLRAGASSRSSDPGSSVRVIRRRRGPDPVDDDSVASQSEDGLEQAQVATPAVNEAQPQLAEVQAAPVTESAPIAEISKVAQEQPIHNETVQSAPTPNISPVTVQTQAATAAVDPVNRPQTEVRTQQAERPAPTGGFQNRPGNTNFGNRPQSGSGEQRPYGNRTYDNSQRGPSPTGSRPEGRRPMSGGATIVRKASPEEIRARTQQYEQQQQARSNYGQRPSGGGGGSGGGYSPQRPTARREDSRGTKYTGFGSVPDVTPTIDPLSEEGRAARRVKEKRKEVVPETEEESLIAKKAAASKGARKSNYNLRQLLSEVEDLDGPDVIDDPAVAEVVEDPQALKQRTVYMPNASQKRRDLKRRKDLKRTEVTVARQAYRVVRMGAEITVGELAHQLKIKATDIIKKLMDQGVMATINQSIDLDTATLIAGEYQYEIKSTIMSHDDVLGREVAKADEAIGNEVRPPIVTVMGHVDHGKTSILDAIRKTSVATGEAGGITQHIGAYAVEHNGKKIAFLDTPGHEAFSAMRARGANLTDIVVLVVAADDGVMPQTIEAISHARDAKVPIIVAVNKIDKEQANIDRIYRELSEREIIAEEWGGDTQFVKCSALTKSGIDDLLEAIVLQAEVLELKTSSEIPAEGLVVEAHLEPGRGPVATIMVKHGTLNGGDYIVAGQEFGRVRAMYDYNGKRVESAGPSTPVEVLGLSGVPVGGDRANVVKDEKTAREAVSWVAENLKKIAVKSSAQSLEDLLGRMQVGETPELPVIVRADTQGSLEAIVDSITKLNSDRVKNRVVHRAVGGISESDISLAATSGAVVIGFNVRAARGLDESAEKRGVVIRYFSIIYDLVDSVKALMAGKLPSILEEVVIGRAEVRQTISVPKFGTIAGSSVTDGRIARSSSLRLIRENVVIYSGKISSLRRFKDDVKEVKFGFECGIGIENYNDIKIGDVIEAYEIKETRPTL